MGMFDSLIVQCPSCSQEVEFQSKGGKCQLIRYTCQDIPMDVLGGCINDEAQCACGKILGLQAQSLVGVRIIQ